LALLPFQAPSFFSWTSPLALGRKMPPEKTVTNGYFVKSAKVMAEQGCDVGLPPLFPPPNTPFSSLALMSSVRRSFFPRVLLRFSVSGWSIGPKRSSDTVISVFFCIIIRASPQVACLADSLPSPSNLAFPRLVPPPFVSPLRRGCCFLMVYLCE